jgi:hypothetical protein
MDGASQEHERKVRGLSSKVVGRTVGEPLGVRQPHADPEDVVALSLRDSAPACLPAGTTAPGQLPCSLKRTGRDKTRCGPPATGYGLLTTFFPEYRL